MVQKDVYLKKIIDIFSREKCSIKTLSEQGLLDEHNYWEDIVCHLLNMVLGYDFVNLNRKQKNFPGIDLGDADTGIGVQVSATKTSSKINTSLTNVIENKVYQTYPHFIMFVLGNKQDTYSIKVFNDNVHFDVKNDIYDFDYLVTKIKELDFEEIKEIYEYLDRELNKHQENNFRTNLSFILGYLNDSLQWLSLASENGNFFTDAQACDQYNERCEQLAGILPQEEYNELYSMLTEMNQAVDYMKQGIAYLNNKGQAKFRYADMYTIMLSNSIKSKASSAYSRKDIIEKINNYLQ